MLAKNNIVTRLTSNLGNSRRKDAIVLGVTSNLDFALGTFLISFFKHNKHFRGTVVVFHDGFSSEQKDVLRKIYAKMVFKTFTVQDLYERLNVPNLSENKHAKALIERFSPLNYSKMELLSLLDEYEKCIWFDVDMLVRKDLSDFWEFEGFAWRPVVPKMYEVYKGLLDHFSYLGENATSIPQGGVIAVSRHVRDHFDCTSEALWSIGNAIFTDPEAHTVNAIDEMSYCLLAASRKAPFREYPLAYNQPSTMAGIDMACVIHAVGEHKFWNASSLKTTFPEWGQHQRSWVLLGGTAFKGKDKLKSVHPEKTHEVILAARKRLYWQDIYSHICDQLPNSVYPDLRTDRGFMQYYLSDINRKIHLQLGGIPKSNEVKVSLHLKAEFSASQSLRKNILSRLAHIRDLSKNDTKLGMRFITNREPEDIPQVMQAFADAISANRTEIEEIEGISRLEVVDPTSSLTTYSGVEFTTPLHITSRKVS